MSRIDGAFSGNRKALIGYVTVGYPDIEATPNIVRLMVENGCDIIELGIPFSDPLADGPVIQDSSFKALQQGTTLDKCLEVARNLRQSINTPLVFMGYYNPILRYGLEPFCRDCSQAGVDGLIVPDLPPEEGYELEELSRLSGIDLIYLIAPTSEDYRIELVCQRSRGFIYLVSITGVTGSSAELSPELDDFVKRVRAHTSKPLCVGFGIKTPQQAERVAGVADGIIVGSQIIKKIEMDPSLEQMKAFVRDLRAAL